MVTRVITVCLVCGALAPLARSQDPQVQSLTQELESLHRRVSELEARPAMQLGKPPQTQAGQVPSRGNLDDRQTPAPRPDNLALQPEMVGFFPVFGSSALLKFNAKPRVEATLDSRNTGNQDRFVPALFPLPGEDDYDSGDEFNMNANATQFSVEVRDPDNPNGYRFYYQNDFFAETNRNMRYRLQHAYGQTHNLVAGFTYGVFEDPDIWPDTVDYEGPNSLIFARRPVLHYLTQLGREWNMRVGIEQPDIYLDTAGTPTARLSTRMPDVGLNVRWERRGTGHLQVSAIARSVGVQDDSIDDQYEPAGGANVSLALNVTEKDDIGLLLVGGKGIGGLGNDTSFLDSDAAIDSDGDLVALPYYSAMASYRHRWSEKWRSTLTYGFVSLDSVDGQAPDTYEQSQYASGNLIFAFSPHATTGLELLWGQQTARDDRDTDAFRVQLSLVHWLF